MPRDTRWPITWCSREGKIAICTFCRDAYDRDWNYAIHTYYGLPDVVSLEQRWRDWVMAGSPEIPDSRGRMVAQADAHGRQPVVRAQSPDATSEPAESVPTTRVARPFPKNDDLVAPAPVDRRAMSVRGEEQRSSAIGVADDSDNAEPIDAARAAALRQDGRQQMQSAGWQPAACTASNSARSNSAGSNTAATVAETHTQANSDERAASESSARRRFRTAKERHSVDPNADASKSQSPFEEAPTQITERDLADAQTPFHMEN